MCNRFNRLCLVTTLEFFFFAILFADRISMTFVPEAWSLPFSCLPIFLESARVVSPIVISDVQRGALGTRRATGREETAEGGPFCSRSPSRCACVWRTDMRIVMSITNEDSRPSWLSQTPAAVTAARVSRLARSGYKFSPGCLERFLLPLL